MPSHPGVLNSAKSRTKRNSSSNCGGMGPKGRHACCAEREHSDTASRPELTPSIHLVLCRPMQLWVQSRNSLRAWKLLNAVSFGKVHNSHGAMMTLAPGWGTLLPSILSGTLDNQPSSSHESDNALSEYHDPAWVGLRFMACTVASIISR